MDNPPLFLDEQPQQQPHSMIAGLDLCVLIKLSGISAVEVISDSHPFPSLKSSRPIRTTLVSACCRATLSDRHATLTSAPNSALSLGMCICCVPMLPTYLLARILYVRVIFSDPRIRGGIGLVGCSGILSELARVLSNLPSCKMHPATTYSLA